MLNRQTFFKTTLFYPKNEQIMSSRGRGSKSRKRDLLDAPQLTSGPAKITNKGNLPKNVKGKGKASRSTSTPTPPPPRTVHQISSSESESEEQENRESSDDNSTGPPEIPVPEGFGDEDDGGDEEEEDFAWKCRLLEFIQQYPEVFDKASPRYKKKNLREAAWEEIATAMESDGI